MNEITVQYDRKFSDGNFGSEGLSLTWTTTVDSELLIERCSAISRALREAVLTELAKSAAPGVANAAKYELNPPTPRQLESVSVGGPLDDDDDEENPF